MNTKKREKQFRVSFIIDTLGLYCPMPIIKLKMGLQQIKDNEIIKILSDDPDFEEDLKQWCHTTGNTFLSLKKNNDILTAFVEKTTNNI